MKPDNNIHIRLYIIFGIFILIALVLLVNADVLSTTWLLGLAFAVIPGFILLKVLEYIYGILAVFNSVDIMEYEIPHRNILKFFGLLPMFELFEKLNTRVNGISLENQLLYDTNLAIHTSSSLNQLLDTVIARLVTHSGADFGVVFLLDREKNIDELRTAASFNVMEINMVKKSFRIGEGIVGWAVKEGKEILSQDVEKDRRYILCVRETKSQMTLPLKAGGKVTGVILLGSYEIQRFKAKDLTLFKNIASEIGLAVSNTWLTQKLLEEKERVALLYETAQQLAASINLDDVAEIGVKTVYDSVDATSCSLMLFDEQDELLKIVKSKGLSEDTERMVKLRVGEGIAGRVFQERKPILVRNVAEEPQFKVFQGQKEQYKSLYSVPLKTQDGCIGTINVATDESLIEDKCKLVNAIASQVSVAVGNALLYESIEQLAIQDGLTGLYNYRYFQQALAKEFERARRYQRALSLVIIDVDDFKKYNDNYGHLTGDYLLSEIGNIIQENIRDSDILARYGGDELAVILPETDDEEALILFERIKNKVDEYNFETKVPQLAASDEQLDSDKDVEHGKKIKAIKGRFFQWLNDKGIVFKGVNGLPTMHVTVSAGICGLSDEITDKDELIKKADQALLKAKRMGKNQICVWK
ncbi:MAG: diguanylate cyclase [Tepidanaerobacteraceae bacterium]|nr:diguanylate cyclase [Tepidanaerobacteraceae bacterium]